MSKRNVTFNTLEVMVEYDYIPAEPQQKYSGDLDGYPGADSKVEISSVYIHQFYPRFEDDMSLTSFFEESGLMYKLEEQLKQEIDKGDD
jgi:hypothetical protein